MENSFIPQTYNFFDRAITYKVFSKNFGAKIVMGTFFLPETIYEVICKKGLIKLIIKLIKIF